MLQYPPPTLQRKYFRLYLPKKGYLLQRLQAFYTLNKEPKILLLSIIRSQIYNYIPVKDCEINKVSKFILSFAENLSIMEKHFDYPDSVKESMKAYYEQLPERSRRQYAAIESLKLGWGGQTYICNLFVLTQKTLRKGLQEIKNPEENASFGTVRQRKIGGGRTFFFVKEPTLFDLLSEFLSAYKAGSPTEPDVYWISLTRSQIRRLFYEKHEIKLTNRFIRQVVNRLGYRYKSIKKDLATDEYARRDEQFKIIFDMVALISLQNPIFSIDCKKKELLGTLYRNGKVLTIGQQKSYDHDFPKLGKGKVIPHGIYDLQTNKGFITIGNSSETADFITDNLRYCWETYGIHQYPDAKHMMLLCDAGGGNSYRHHAFKKALQRLAKEIGLDIIVCHYPPYASKWNPIEHRLFCHVHKAMSGQMFPNYETVQELIQNTRTDTGLTVEAHINLKEYKTGIKTAKSEVDEKRIQYHKDLPKLNYRIAA